MAYIGKQPSTKFSAAAKIDTFTGDGSTVAFDLANIVPAGGENGLQVYVNNVRQKPGASNAYTLGNDGSGDLKRITFTEAPEASAEIYVITTYEATNIKNVPDGTITNEKIVDGAIDNASISPSAAIADTKLATISTSGKVATSAISQPGSPGVYLDGTGSWSAIDTSQQDTNAFNIGLLGFKMAVNEGLTVFNLVDGVVDEFNDESGTDEAEGTNDTYCASGDFYQNISFTPSSASAGFTTTSITEPDTSTTGTNPTHGSGTMGVFTVPNNMSSANIYVWGAAGGLNGSDPACAGAGGGGGFASGTLAVTPGQTLYVSAGEGGFQTGSPCASTPNAAFLNGGWSGTIPGPGIHHTSGGGGLSGVFNADLVPLSAPQYSAPQAYIVGGSGGGTGYNGPQPYSKVGGAGGGLLARAGGANISGATNDQTAGNFSCKHGGGGGDQEQGGQGYPGSPTAQPGGLFRGGFNGPAEDISMGSAGGAGFYGGGAGGKNGPGGPGDPIGSGGGGSSYYGHPQVSCGATEEGGNSFSIWGESGGVASPFYICGVGEGGVAPGGGVNGEDGYVLITGAFCAPSPGASTTIVSTAFTSTSVPTSARIVVFEENVDTPTLNTDIIASISRDGGTTYTNATLSDSGYVTGSSGQRILTGQATISGQPSGQSMRWKLALANNTVKIHGVSLQWA